MPNGAFRTGYKNNGKLQAHVMALQSFREAFMMTKRSARREFDASVKLEVVRMVKDQKLPVSDICRSMDLGETVIHFWLKQYQTELNG